MTEAARQPDGDNQCPRCGTPLEPWSRCHICDFHSLEWWSEQLGEEATDSHRIEKAFFATDEASASLSTLEERIPRLEVSDDWDADSIRNLNKRLNRLRSAVSDIGGVVAGAYLALDEVYDEYLTGDLPASGDRRRVWCPDCGLSGAVHGDGEETWMECDEGHEWDHKEVSEDAG